MKDFKNGIIVGLLLMLGVSTYCYAGANEQWNYWMDQDAINQELIDDLRAEVKELQAEIDSMQV